MDDFTCMDERLGEERSFDIRGTSVQGTQVSLSWRDVTERHRSADRIAQSEERYRQLVESTLDVSLRISLDGIIEWSSAASLPTLGWIPEQLIGRSFAELVHADDRAGFATWAEHVAGSREPDSLTPRLLRGDDRYAWVSLTAQKVPATGDQGSYHAFRIRDVDQEVRAQRALAESERQYRLMAENASDVVMHVRDEVIAWISPSITTALGGRPSTWLGRSLRDLVHPFDLHAYAEAMERLAAGESVVQRVRVRSEAGAYHWMEAHLSPFRIETGEIDGASASMRNVDAEVQALAELDRQARFDALTGLASRREALHRLAEARAPDRLPGGELAVLFCDIDRFKEINDQYGHAVGDTVLRVLAQRISDAVRLGDVVARMGGDELLVLMNGVHELSEAMRVAEKLRERAREPIQADGHQVHTSLSIGVTLSGVGESVDDLVAKADSAMYQAKRAGRDQVAAFTAAAR